MSTSKYQAAAAYDLKQENQFPVYAVIDLEDGSAGLCRQEQGRLNLERTLQPEPVNFWDLFVKQIQQAVPDLDPESLEGLVLEQSEKTKAALEDYFSSFETVDETAFQVSETNLSCSEFLKGFDPAKEKLISLADQIRESLSEDELSDTRFVLMGQAAVLWVLEYVLRESFSVDPLLPDPRFDHSYPDDPSEIAERGEEILKAEEEVPCDYRLKIFDSDTGEMKTICELKKGQMRSECQKPEYSEPILILNGDRLEYEAGQETRSIPLPYSMNPLKADLVQAAFQSRDKQEVLSIRRYLFPAEIYAIPLESETSKA